MKRLIAGAILRYYCAIQHLQTQPISDQDFRRYQRSNYYLACPTLAASAFMQRKEENLFDPTR